MKILVVTSQYGNLWSGLGTYATNLIHGLASAGHEITVLCPGLDPARADPRLRIVDSSAISVAPHMSNWLLLAWQFNKVVQRLLASEHFEVVHFADAREGLFCRSSKTLTSGMMNDYYFVEADRNPLHYRKYYSDWIKRWLFYNFSRVFEKHAIRALPLVLTNTEYVRQSLVAHYGADPARVHTVYYGLEGQHAAAATTRLEGTPSVLFAGSNFERKGLPALLKAMEIVVRQHPAAMLHVVGKDPKLRLLQAAAATAGIGGNVKFYGGMDNAKLLSLYPAADMFVMPSLIEGFGLVFLEAMAAGTPVIGGLCGGTPELIRDGENGFVVPPDQPGLLAQRMLQLQGDSALRQAFAAAGRATHAQYSIQRMTNATVALFEKFKPV